MKDSNLYLPLWKKYLPVIAMKLRNSVTGAKSLQLHKDEFEVSGNRPASDYTFTLEVKNGRLINDISGTAVAKDLYEAISCDRDAKKVISSGHFKINLGKNYMLNITFLES